MTIRYLFDIGGTHIRTAFFLKGNIYGLKKEKHNFSSINELLNELSLYIEKYRFSEYGKGEAVIAIAGIVDKNIIISSTNLAFLNGCMIPNIINDDVPICVINDADSCLFGEMIHNNIDEKKNILSLIFGTGVGSGLFINNKLVKNSEVDGLFENYMVQDSFEKYKVEEIYKLFKINLENVVELLNIDTAVINGFIKKYRIFKKIKKEINVRPYFKHKLKIIFSNCEEPVIKGCCSNKHKFIN